MATYSEQKNWSSNLQRKKASKDLSMEDAAETLTNQSLNDTHEALHGENGIHDEHNGSHDEQAKDEMMALNVAYEALEQLRTANLAIEFGKEASANQCVPCFRQHRNDQTEDRGSTSNWSRFQKPKLSSPCLACGYNVCTQHRCLDFGRENITICIECIKFFSLDFVADATELSSKDRLQLMNHMLDVYDRAWLILQYSSQFIDEICQALEEGNKSKDKFGLGSSATGFVGGLIGVAGALTIWTPVGVPLLLTSVVFGSAGAATSAGSERMFHQSSAFKAADTLITVHALLQSLARLSPSYCVEHAAVTENQEDDSGNAIEAEKSHNTQQQPPGQSEQRDSKRKLWIRATTNALKPFTLGVLSAASIVMEAREIKTTVEKLRSGSPCLKASLLKETIATDATMFPPTKVLAEECSHYFLRTN